MSGVSSQFMSFSSRILVPSLNWSTNFCRSYVRAFWAKNNDSPFIHGHKRNPPKMGNYVRGKRNVMLLIFIKSFIFIYDLSYTKQSSILIFRFCSGKNITSQMSLNE